MKKILEFFNPKAPRWQDFYSNLQQDLKFFIFIWLLIMVFRAAFLIIFKDNLLPQTPFKDILLTFYYGGRISLKSAAAFTIIPFVFATLLQLAAPGLLKNKVRLYWGFFAIALLCGLFNFRIPYFIEFGNAFDIFLFNTFNDDVGAIVDTSIKQYQAVWRTIAAVIMAVVFGFIYKKYIGLKTFKFKKTAKLWLQILTVLLTVAFIVCFAFLTRFGGAFAYKKGIYWKNAARLNQHVLNEAIYDDIQAMYRAKKTHEYLSKSKFKNLTAAQVKNAVKELSGKEYAQTSLLPYFAKTAGGAKIKKPKHIFLIVGETYMLWPMLKDYQYLGIADGLLEIANKKDGALLTNFLPASNGTMASVTSIIIGMPDMNLYPSFRPTAQKVYETSLPAQLQKLGYETNFFYGGFHSWENVSTFAAAQGFDNVHFYGSLDKPKNAWGLEDKYFFEAMRADIKDAAPTFNYILTSSNHPPLTVNIEPAVIEEIKSKLPANLKQDENLLTKLAHFQYADRLIAQFIADTRAQLPDSLFIITGDHAQRWHINPNASEYEKAAVPLIFYGNGINKNTFDAQASGSHIDIMPALLELIAPKGHSYHALGNNLQRANTGIHINYWIHNNLFGNNTSEKIFYINNDLPQLTQPEINKIKKEVKNKQEITYWRVVNGTNLD